MSRESTLFLKPLYLSLNLTRKHLPTWIYGEGFSTSASGKNTTGQDSPYPRGTEMAFACSSNCRVADSPRKYYHQVQRLHEMTLQRLARYTRVRSISDTGTSLPIFSDIDEARRRHIKEASRSPLLASGGALKRFRDDAYEMSDLDLTSRRSQPSINTRNYGTVGIYVTRASPQPSETNLLAAARKPRAKLKGIRTSSNFSTSKLSLPTTKRNQIKMSKLTKNAEPKYTRRTLSQNNTPLYRFPRSRSNDSPMGNKTPHEGQTLANQILHSKQTSRYLLPKDSGVTGVDGSKFGTRSVVKRSTSKDLNTPRPARASQCTLNKPGSASASSFPKKGRSSTITPYGSKSHNYTPTKNCPSSIYEARRQESLEVNVFRKGLAEYESKICLHCYGIYPYGTCRETKHCGHYQRKMKQASQMFRASQGSKSGKESGEKQKISSDKSTPDETTLRSIANLLLQMKLCNKANSTSKTSSREHKENETDLNGTIPENTDASASGKDLEKFFIDFEDTHKTTCNIIARKEALLSETPTLIRLMTVEVDVMIQPLNPTKSPSIASSSYADSYAYSSIGDSDQHDAMSTLSGLSSCFDDLNNVMINDECFGETQDNEPTPEKDESQVANNKVKHEGAVVLEMKFGRLHQFCKISALNFCISLEKIKLKKKKDADSTTKFSRSKVCWSGEAKRLGCPTILKNRLVTDACFCPREANMLLTLHGEPENDPDNFQGTLISVWNTEKSYNPRNFLIAAAKINCICFSPLSAGMAFSCMGDGSVGLWDLEEPDSMHRIVTIKKEKFVLRYPTYTTPSGEYCRGHSSPAWSIIAIYPISSRRAHLKRRPLMPPSSTPFQIATVEEAGVIIFWQVKKLAPTESTGKGQPKIRSPPQGHNYQLVMNLKIRLIQDFPVSPNPTSHGTLLLKINHQDPAGKTAMSINRFYQRKPEYIPVSEPQILTGPTLGISSMVQCVDFSPYDPLFFLVGYEDGRMFLCHAEKAAPILSIPVSYKEKKPVMKVQWSPSRPTVFFVLHGDLAVNIFDLCESTQHAVRTLHINDGPILTMALSPDLRGPYNQQRPTVLLAGTDGLIVLRELNKVATELSSREEANFLQALANNT